MHIKGAIVVSIKHVAKRGKNVAIMVTCLVEMVLHPIISMLETWFIYKNIATDNVNLLVANHVSSMHIKGAIVVSIKHVAK